MSPKHIIVLFLYSFVLGQNPILLKGTVKDELSKEAIPGVEIITTTGEIVYTDSLGKFVVEVLEGDSLLFSVPFGIDTLISAKDILCSNVVYVEQNAAVNEVMITAKKTTRNRIFVGFRKKGRKNGYYFGGPKGRYFVYIPNKNKVKGYICLIEFMISSKHKDNKCKCLVNLWSVGENGLYPNKKILKNYFIIDVYKYGRRIKLKLIEPIKFPDTGVFIEFRWFCKSSYKTADGYFALRGYSSNSFDEVVYFTNLPGKRTPKKAYIIPFILLEIETIVNKY